MKLLFDQNVSSRLARSPADIFPDSAHVGTVGLGAAPDELIWEFAKSNDFVVDSKDFDFQQRSLLFGSPPKFVWLRVGSCTVDRIERLLRDHSIALQPFDPDASKAHLLLP